MSTPAKGEFALIASHLTALGTARVDVALGVGDDAALLVPTAGTSMVVASAGTGVGGALDADEAGRSCAVEAFAGLRAAGARPAWVTVALSLESADEAWVARFAAALGDVCAAAGASVIGGDTTAGRPAVTVFATGLAPRR